MSENPRRGRQARNFTTNDPKILDLKSSSELIFFRKLTLGAPVKTSVVNVVAAGFPVFLFPALLDHVMSFLLLYGVTRYISWNDSHEVTTF